ncbi:hypothetical protein P7K49_023349 [Saguinus oedipus]|uniref:Uncharacterized protein n=1 Tax=Saguinus oedipus TaxID=9490 RepID=A0ABQ9UMZ1_SAGOE|nr:hypothetical protein P7K49_023349 [Saguinus oedipus]
MASLQREGRRSRLQRGGGNAAARLGSPTACTTRTSVPRSHDPVPLLIQSLGISAPTPGPQVLAPSSTAGLLQGCAGSAGPRPRPIPLPRIPRLPSPAADPRASQNPRPSAPPACPHPGHGPGRGGGAQAQPPGPRLPGPIVPRRPSRALQATPREPRRPQLTALGSGKSWKAESSPRGLNPFSALPRGMGWAQRTLGSFSRGDSRLRTRGPVQGDWDGAGSDPSFPGPSSLDLGKKGDSYESREEAGKPPLSLSPVGAGSLGIWGSPNAREGPWAAGRSPSRQGCASRAQKALFQIWRLLVP